MPVKSFADQTTADIFYARDTKDARRIPKDVWSAARRKMALVDAAKDTREFGALGGLQFKPLKHDRPGFNSIRINDNYRLIFQFQNGDAYAVGIENYHGRKTT